jgi:hypothetical protein
MCPTRNPRNIVITMAIVRGLIEPERGISEGQ